MLTAAQIRAARALLDWSQKKLAEMAKLSVPTVKRMEGPMGPEHSTLANVEAIKRACETGGVIFLDPTTPKEGPGVRLKRSPQVSNR